MTAVLKHKVLSNCLHAWKSHVLGVSWSKKNYVMHNMISLLLQNNIIGEKTSKVYIFYAQIEYSLFVK